MSIEIKSLRRVVGGWLLAASLGAGNVAAGQSAGFVSVQELRNPMPRKAESLFKKLLDPNVAPEAVADLRKNLQDPQLAPYALKALGMRHINSSQFPEAIGELMEASRAMPWDAQAMGLWSFALYANGAWDESAEIARHALALNPRDAGANLVLGLTGLDDKNLSNPKNLSEFERKMRLASDTFPGARLILWEYYRERGKKEKAEREMEEFRKREVLLPAGNRQEVRDWIGQRLSH